MKCRGFYDNKGTLEKWLTNWEDRAMELHSVALLKPFCCPSLAILLVFIRY